MWKISLVRDTLWLQAGTRRRCRYSPTCRRVGLSGVSACIRSTIKLRAFNLASDHHNRPPHPLSQPPHLPYKPFSNISQPPQCLSPVKHAHTVQLTAGTGIILDSGTLDPARELPPRAEPPTVHTKVIPTRFAGLQAYEGGPTSCAPFRVGYVR